MGVGDQSVARRQVAARVQLAGHCQRVESRLLVGQLSMAVLRRVVLAGKLAVGRLQLVERRLPVVRQQLVVRRIRVARRVPVVPR